MRFHRIQFYCIKMRYSIEPRDTINKAINMVKNFLIALKNLQQRQ